jgi:peptide/nickel transport system permease protein
MLKRQSMYILTRLLRAVSVIVALIAITFFLTRAVSDPVSVALPLNATTEQREHLTREIGLDKPLPAQFVDYVGRVLHGDFGDSVWLAQPALPLVVERLPLSLLLAASAILLAVVVGLTLGLLGGLRPGSMIDRVAVLLSAISVAIPDFWLGVMLILIFSVELGWLPTAGYNGIEYLIMPACTLALRPAGRLARVAREAIMDEMGKQYIVAVRARGLRTREVVTRHVMKNIAIATSTVAGYDFLFMFTGYAIGVEVVFGWPGVGRLSVEATLHEDVVLVSAIVLILGIIIAVGNTILDIAHAAIDRRVGD